MGTTVFMRTKKLEALLDSASSAPISKVFVADNGVTSDRAHLYERPYPFELEVLDLDYDAGLGRSRCEIVDAATQEDFLLIVDCDMEIPRNVGTLRTQLEQRREFGGISGILLENGSIRSGCWDLRECGIIRNDDVIMLEIPREKRVEPVAGAPLARFDAIPNAAVFRTECLHDHCWDPELVLEEHLDFYVGHKKCTHWRFGVCPQVVFPHDQGGSREYTEIRDDRERIDRFRRRSLDKWGYRKRIYRTSRGWLDTRPQTSAIGTARSSIMAVAPLPIRIIADDIVRGRSMG